MQAVAGGGGKWYSALRALLCAHCRAQVFIRSARETSSVAFVCVNHCGLCGSRTANMAARQMECVLAPAFMAANWCRIGQRSTLTALTSSSPLLTY